MFHPFDHEIAERKDENERRGCAETPHHPSTSSGFRRAFGFLLNKAPPESGSRSSQRLGVASRDCRIGLSFIHSNRPACSSLSDNNPPPNSALKFSTVFVRRSSTGGWLELFGAIETVSLARFNSEAEGSTNSPTAGLLVTIGSAPSAPANTAISRQVTVVKTSNLIS